MAPVSDTTRSTSKRGDTLTRGGARRILWIAPLAALAIPLVANEYHQYVVNLILVYVLVGVGFNVVVGNLGQLAFSNVAFFGIGAYAAGTLMHHLAWPWWVALVPAGMFGALAGCAASVPALRGVRLFYLAVMTLAFGELMRWTYIRADVVTGGSMGLRVPPADLLGWALDSEYRKFYVFLAVVVVLVILTDNLLRSRFGRAFMAIKFNEEAAAAVGVATSRYFLLAFAWSGFVVGVGGGMYAALVGHISPEAFNLVILIQQFAVVMVGGIGSLTGSVLGAIVITSLPEVFREFPGFEELAFGLAIILVLLFLPRGLTSLVARIHPAFRDRYFRD